MFIKDSIILLCFYDFLGWRCVLAGIYTCEHRAQMGNVYNSITVTWASSSKHDEFHFSFSIAQFYESNLISHVFLRRIPWAQVHFLIQSHEWCLESFGNCTSHGSAFWKPFLTKWVTINYDMQELFMHWLNKVYAMQTYQEIWIYVHVYNLKIVKFITQTKF